MAKTLISNVVDCAKVVLKRNGFKQISNLVMDLNKTYGYNRFTDVTLNKVYYVDGCGILMEFQDAENSMSIIADGEGRVLSCKLAIEGIEALSVLNRFSCGMSNNCLVLG